MHVTELIGKQPRIDLPSPRPADADQPPPPGALENLLAQADEGPSSHRRPPSKGAQLAKIAGLGVASFALCASIAYASMITHQRQNEAATEAGARPAVDISGEEALRPDVLNRVIPKAGITGVPELPGAPTNATGMIENPGGAQPPVAPPAGPPAPGTVGDPDSKRALVEQFYRLVPSAPDRAFALLAPGLLGTDVKEFVRAWTSVSDVQLLEVREHGEDVLAVVRLRVPDGSYLRVQQLLNIADTMPRKIVGAEILSAQRN